MKKKEPKSLGGRIRYLRADLTQSEYADILRIKQAMVSRYEADKETPSPSPNLPLNALQEVHSFWHDRR